MWDDAAAAIRMADAVIAATGFLAVGVIAGVVTIEILLTLLYRAAFALLLVDVALVIALGAQAFNFAALLPLNVAILLAQLLAKQAVIRAHAAGICWRWNHLVRGFIDWAAGNCEKSKK